MSGVFESFSFGEGATASFPTKKLRLRLISAGMNSQPKAYFSNCNLMVIYTLVNQRSNGKWTLWRCISYWKLWCSIAMLVYQRVPAMDRQQITQQHHIPVPIAPWFWDPQPLLSCDHVPPGAENICSKNICPLKDVPSPWQSCKWLAI